MMHCVRIVGEDSVEAMAKVTRELGADAVILSTKQIRGGIEIIASRAEAVNEAEAGEVRAASSGKSRAEEFAALLEKKRNEASQPRTRPATAAAAPRPQAASAPQAPAIDPRIDLLERSLTEIKAMLSSDLMVNGLRSAGASPALISVFLAQAGAVSGENSDQKFAAFLAKRMQAKESMLSGEGGRVVVTLGPSGSGKTTLLAQLAAKLRMMRPDERMTFVNADQDRLASSEQMRSFARILDVPVIDIERPATLTEFARSTGRQVSIFVNMPSDFEQASDLLDVLNDSAPDMAPLVRCGVIPSNLCTEAVEDLLDRYPSLDGVALTKLNEMRLTLSTVSLLALRGTSVSFLSSSSHLLKGVVEPDTETLERLIRGSLPGAAKESLN
jgi:flagellar biosynthesis protein FlhF